MQISISAPTNLPYYRDCSQFSRSETDRKGGLSDIVDSGKEISFTTLQKRVNNNDLNMLLRHLGYDKDFKIENDYAVSFMRSKLFGKTVYYIRHSSIEYIFGDL